MVYSVHCECGKSHRVQATQAGAALLCQCGRQVDIPTLSSLRSSAGESPVPLNTIQQIRAMIRDGTLPANEICPMSARPATTVIWLHVQCERVWTENEGGGRDLPKLILALLLHLHDAVRRESYKPPIIKGRDTSVDVPLRVSPDVIPAIRKTCRQRKLKMLLEETPIYRQLLGEYPEALVWHLDDADRGQTSNRFQ
jgi:hypothetical protein